MMDNTQSEQRSLPTDLEMAVYSHTEWDWNYGATWGGLARKDIEPVLPIIAERAGLSPQEARKTDIIFGSAIQTEDEDGVPSPPEIGIAPGEYAEGGEREIEHVYVILNRFDGVVNGAVTGRDLFERPTKTAQQEEYRAMGIYDDVNGEAPVECRFETPDEFVWWAISEEMRHAKQHFTHGTFHNWENATRLRAQALQQQGRRVRRVDDVIQDEVDATQFAARMVAEILEQKGKPERAAYFRQVAEEAKRRDLHITMEFNF